MASSLLLALENTFSKDTYLSTKLKIEEDGYKLFSNGCIAFIVDGCSEFETHRYHGAEGSTIAFSWLSLKVPLRRFLTLVFFVSVCHAQVTKVLMS